jgi:lycopene cyclase domain-containing protein
MLGHRTYLTIILVPGIMGIVVTWILGRKVLIPRKVKRIALIVAALTVYLVAIDLLAIHTLHIWSFRAQDVIGIRIAGDYIEEWVLFIVTQTIIVSWAFILKEPKKSI